MGLGFGAHQAVGQTHLDLTISVPANMTVVDSHAVEGRVRDAIISARREVREVKIHVHGESQSETMERERLEREKDQEKENESGATVGRVTSDFGKDGC